AAEKVAQGLFALVRGDSLQMSYRAGFDVELFELVLGEVADRQVAACRDGAGQRFEVAGQRPHEGGFASAVEAEQANAVARREAGAYLVENDRFAVAQTHAVEMDQRVGRAWRLGKLEI